jgi:uncharacterized coiled-coil DUF342 family protein
LEAEGNVAGAAVQQVQVQLQQQQVPACPHLSFNATPNLLSYATMNSINTTDLSSLSQYTVVKSVPIIVSNAYEDPSTSTLAVQHKGRKALSNNNNHTIPAASISNYSTPKKSNSSSLTSNTSSSKHSKSKSLHNSTNFSFNPTAKSIAQQLEGLDENHNYPSNQLNYDPLLATQQYYDLLEKNKSLEIQLTNHQTAINILTNQLANKHNQLINERKIRYALQIDKDEYNTKLNEFQYRVNAANYQISQLNHQCNELNIFYDLTRSPSTSNHNNNGTTTNMISSDSSNIVTSPTNANINSNSFSSNHSDNSSINNPNSIPSTPKSSISSSNRSNTNTMNLKLGVHSTAAELLSKARCDLSSALNLENWEEMKQTVYNLFDELLEAHELYMTKLKQRNNEKSQLQNQILKLERDLKSCQQQLERATADCRKNSFKLNETLAELNDINDETKLLNQQIIDKTVENSDLKREMKKEVHSMQEKLTEINLQLMETHKSNSQLARRVYYYKTKADSFELPVRKYEVNKVLTNQPSVNAQLIIKKIPSTGQILLAVNSPDMDVEIQQDIDTIKLQTVEQNDIEQISEEETLIISFDDEENNRSNNNQFPNLSINPQSSKLREFVPITPSTSALSRFLISFDNANDNVVIIFESSAAVRAEILNGIKEFCSGEEDNHHSTQH